MSMDKRKILLLSLVAMMIMGFNVFKTIENSSEAKVFLSLSGIEALGQYENGPGHYENAHNEYCSKPAGVMGCVQDPDPTRICNLSVFCKK